MATFLLIVFLVSYALYVCFVLLRPKPDEYFVYDCCQCGHWGFDTEDVDHCETCGAFVVSLVADRSGLEL